jgi:CRP/FNR family cyclic AMP-dependent transcriptional regulator
MSPERTKLWYLKNLDIFSHMRTEEYKLIDQYSSMKEVAKGDILYLQGASDKNVYLLKKGAVKITKLTPQGNEIILDIFSGGSMFGEMSVIDPQERDESAVVVENGLLCIMKKEDFERLIQMAPGLAIRLSKMIGLKRWKIENKLLDLLYRTVNSGWPEHSSIRLRTSAYRTRTATCCRSGSPIRIMPTSSLQLGRQLLQRSIR